MLKRFKVNRINISFEISVWTIYTSCFLVPVSWFHYSILFTFYSFLPKAVGYAYTFSLFTFTFLLIVSSCFLVPVSWFHYSILLLFTFYFLLYLLSFVLYPLSFPWAWLRPCEPHLKTKQGSIVFHLGQAPICIFTNKIVLFQQFSGT